MRVILHSDCNGFFASVECLYNPDIRNKPVAVCGDVDKRHGIVLAKNELAKKYKVTTGEAVWQARQKCPELVIAEPHYDRYVRFSGMAGRIYREYTDRIEPFGIDESWLDVSGGKVDFDEGKRIADELRRRIKYELGITVSVGVSFNKVFAKLGSDYKKPDAVTVITPDNFRDVVWRLPTGDLLGVGHSTAKKLDTIGIRSIGDIATAPPLVLSSNFGKWGIIMQAFANGHDSSPVKEAGYINVPKSIGNSTTSVRDLCSYEDVKIVMKVLCDSVCRRMREQKLRTRRVSISVRDSELFTFTRQTKVRDTGLTDEVTATALGLFAANYGWEKPLRSIGVTLSDFIPDILPTQPDMFCDENRRIRLQSLDSSLDRLKGRFGSFCVRPAVLLSDRALSGFSPKEEHTIHPVGFFS